ncbi:MAG TPA: RHS repeat-associated core domain-containing protein [Pyrinomonadaceae bacterium]|nr:RHS repeat-associated core domain-containing protein [Pyrinomonadaceae bacterium]
MLTSSTPAAPQTIVSVTSETAIDLGFWFHNSGLAKWLQGEGSGSRKKQQKQADRDALITSLQIFPGDVTVERGERVRFSAVAYDQENNPIGGVKIKWSAKSSAQGRRVRVTPQGEFEGIAAGSFTVTAEAADKMSASVQVTVKAGPARNKGESPSGVRQVSTRDNPEIGSIEKKQSSSTPALSSKVRNRPETNKTSVRKNHRSGRNHSAATKAMPVFLDDGWGDSNYWSADDPGNTVGNPPTAPMDGGSGSGNHQFVAPVLGLPGRGINVTLSLVYNSRLWNKANSQINYDNDRGWPAPGFSLGFGKMLGISINSGCMLVDADGTRHSYTGTIQFFSWGTIGTMHTTDGSFIDYTYQTGTNGVITSGQARLANGTVITYGAYSQSGGGVFPTSIEDANGNFITITYVNNAGPRIQTVTDTLSRTISFHYNSNNLLTAITAPTVTSGTRTLLRLHYHQLALSYGFSGLTASVRDANPWVVDAIYYPGTNNGYWLNDSDSYSSYGMLAKVIEQRAMGFSSSGLTDMGTVSQGSLTRKLTYNYPLTPNFSLTDAPTYTTQTETWTRDGTNFDSATTSYELHENDTPRVTIITFPNGTKNKQLAFNAPNQYNDGLVYHDETYVVDGQPLQSSNSFWEQGAYGSARPTRVENIDERNQMTASEFGYGTVYNQVTEIRDYDYGGAVLLRKTQTTYQNSTNYTNRHIFNLPLTVEVRDPGNVRLSRTEYQYDGQTLTDAPSVGMHNDASNPYAPQWEQCDCGLWDHWQIECLDWRCNWISNYNPATDYRGNVTQVTTYADGTNMSGAITDTLNYDITGNVVTGTSSCCEQTSFTYTIDTQFAYPTAKTRGSASDPFAQVKITASYDFNTGLGLSAVDGNGRQTTTSYDPNTLRATTAVGSTGSHTDYAYDDSAMTITTTTYVSASEGSGIADQNVKYLNGNGRVWQEKILGAGGVFDFVNTVYNNMGQVSQQSLPYRTGQTQYFNTLTYDDLGRKKVATAPDGSVTQTFYNEASRPSVASSSAGSTTRMQDAWGRERWARNDARGRLVEVVEPDPAGNGSVATNGLLTTLGYDTLGNLTQVVQGAQTRSFKYDSLGRLTAQKLAEVSATLNDSGTYVGSGSWSDVFTYDNRSNLTSRTDARGVKTVYTYNNDPLNRLQSVSWDTSGFGDTSNPILAAATVTYQYRTKSTGTELKDVTQVASVSTASVSTLSFTFDTEGRVSAKTLTLSSRPSYPFVTDYIFDSLSRAKDVRYPASYGNGSAPRKLVHHDYDVASRSSGLTYDGQTQASSLVYNAASQLTSINVGTGPNVISEAYTYHAQTGLMDGQTVMRGATTLLNLSYDYADANGKRTGQLKKLLNNLNHNKDRGYNYDALGRLVQATGGPSASPLWTQSYTYDRYGNRTAVSASGFSAKNERRSTEPPRDLLAKNTFELPAFLHDPTKPVSDSPLTLRDPNAGANANNLSTLAPFQGGPPTFTDDPLVAGTTIVKALHVTELRDAINLLRTRAGIATVSWAESVSAGVLIKASHITEMRTRLEEARAALALAPTSYTDPTLTAGTTPVKAVHIQQMRDSLKAAWNTSSQISRDGHASLSYNTASNRITTTGFAYDAAGNQVRALTAGGSTSQRFQYDAANRLVKVKLDDNTTVIATYTYGNSNERLIAEEGGVRTYFASESGTPIAEFTESGASTIPVWSKNYVYLADRLLSTVTPNGSGGEAVQFHHPDRLGTRLVTNPATGTSFEQVTLPFGTALTAESTGSTNRRFTTYDRSAVTGIDYAINRHYDSAQGRFTQVDPAGMNVVSLTNPQTLNLYAYCMNDPVNHTDPSGLGFFSFLKKLFKWIGIAVSIALIVLGTMGLMLAPAVSVFFGVAGSAITAASIGMIITGGLGLLAQFGPRPVRIIAGFASLAWGLFGAIQSIRSMNLFGAFGWQDQIDVVRIFTTERIRPLDWMDEMKIWLGIIALTPIPTPVNASSGQIDAFRQAFENARDRIVNNSKCARLFGGRLEAIKALYNNHYGFSDLGRPSVVNGSATVTGAATLPTRSVAINSSGPFMNQRLYVQAQMKWVTFNFGTGLTGSNFRALLLLHELGHVRGKFGADAADAALNRAHTQQVQDACF